MYTWSSKTSKTTIHGMDPGWKENPTPYQSPDPSPTYTETPSSPVFYESCSEPGSERRDQIAETHEVNRPRELLHSEEFGSPTYSECSPEPPRSVWWKSPTHDAPVAGNWWDHIESIPIHNFGEWDKSPKYEFEDIGTTSSSNSISKKLSPSISLACSQRLEDSKEDTRKTEIADKRKERSRRSDRYSPYNRRSENHYKRRSISRHESRRYHEERKERDNRRRHHRDNSSKRQDRRQSSYRNSESSSSSDSSRRDERRREEGRRERHQYRRSRK